MKRFIGFVFIALLFLSPVCAQDLTEVLNAHFKAIGQDNRVGIHSLKSYGKTITQGMELDFVMYSLSPDKFRLEVDIQGTQMIQAYDGEKAWFVAPWTGSNDPMELTGAQLKSLKLQANFNGMLYHAKEKEFITELIGKEDMAGTEVYRIKQTDQDGDVYYHFIDTENYFNLKTSFRIKMGESVVETETLMSNYKEINGMVMPFSFESKINGQTMSLINIEKVEVAIEIDHSIFTMPVKQETTAEKKEQ